MRSHAGSKIVRPATFGLIAAAISAGCGGSPQHTGTVRPKTPAPIVTPKTAPKGLSGPPALPAHVVAKLDDLESTPYFARRGDEGLVLFTSHGRWMTRLVSADGAPKAEAVDAGPAVTASVGALRAIGDGYVAAWVELVGKNHAVKTLAFDAAGK